MSSNQNRKRGKRVERRIAKLLGGERIGLLGFDDVRAGKLSIEVKSRKVFMPLKWIDQAESNCKDRVPIVIIHVTGKGDEENIVMLRIPHFLKLVKEEFLPQKQEK